MRHVLLSAVYAVILVTVLPALAAAAKAPTLDAWVLVRAGSKDVHMSGSTHDIKAARAQQQNGESLLYVRRGGKAYVIRDAALLARQEKVWAPVDAHGKKMEAQGKRMEPVGKKMEALGKRMETLGRKMERASGDDEREVLGRQMDELGREMDVLGKEMDALGKEMDVLGKEMDRLARHAEGELAVLVDEAVKSGKAIEVKLPL